MKIKFSSDHFKQKSITLKTPAFSNELFFTLDKKKYTISKDIAFVSIWDTTEKASLTKGLASLAMVAAAGQAASKNHLGTAAVVGVTAASMKNTNTVVEVLFFFDSGKYFLGDMKGSDYAKVAAQTKEIGKDNANAYMKQHKKTKKYIADAPRTIIEVQDKIHDLNQQLIAYTEQADNGKTFDEREMGGQKRDLVRKKLNEQLDLHKILKSKIAEMNGEGGTSETINKGDTKSENRNNWYDNKILTILLLIFLAPIGLYPMFKGKHFHKIIQIIFVLYAVIYGLAVLGSNNPNKVVTKTTIESSQTPK